MSLPAADLLSLARIPLGAAFCLFADRTPLAVGLLVAAGVTDVLDGWLARRSRPPDEPPGRPHRGDWLDPLCDKVFVSFVVTGLYLTVRPPLLLLLLTMTRELLQTVAFAALKWLPRFAGVRYDFRAHPIGKAATVAQFATGLALLLQHPAAPPLAVASAVLGTAAVAVYLRRARDRTEQRREA